jgi:hypothetical protein
MKIQKNKCEASLLISELEWDGKDYNVPQLVDFTIQAKY